MAEPRFDVTTFGEMLIRLSLTSGERLENSRSLEFFPPGRKPTLSLC